MSDIVFIGNKAKAGLNLHGLPLYQLYTNNMPYKNFYSKVNQNLFTMKRCLLLDF